MAQFHPLQVNPKTGEPYLPLPAPHSNIILTPPRLNSKADEKLSIEYLNNMEIAKWLSGPPFPYQPTHAREWIEKTYADYQRILKEIYQTPPGSFINGCPVRVLREIKEDGQDVMIGDCGINPWLFDEILDPEEKDKAIEQNNARAAGDALKEWGFGDYLAPSHHGKGIMSLAIKTLHEQWAIPRMGANIIKANVYVHNIASRRVFEKNGFVLWKTVENYISIPESKGGGMVGIHILKLETAKRSIA